MNSTKSNKKAIYVLGGAIVVLALVYFYFKGSSPISSDLLVANTAADDAASQRVLVLLNQIRSLHIDSTFFNNPAYQSLHDISVIVPAQNVGRDNPFAPIPGFVFNPPSTSGSGARR